MTDLLERRRTSNRISARKSRYRQSVHMEELQRSLQTLSAQNQVLREANEALRKEIAELSALEASQEESVIAAEQLRHATSSFQNGFSAFDVAVARQNRATDAIPAIVPASSSFLNSSRTNRWALSSHTLFNRQLDAIRSAQAREQLAQNDNFTCCSQENCTAQTNLKEPTKQASSEHTHYLNFKSSLSPNSEAFDQAAI